MYKWLLFFILLCRCSAIAQKAAEFRPPLELIHRINAHLPEGWSVKRATDRPNKKELGWTCLPELYYIHMEGPKKWTLSHYSGPPVSAEEEKHLFDEKAEFVDLYIFPNSSLPSEQPQTDPPITAALWSTKLYQGLGCASENFSWPTWTDDMKQVFTEVFPTNPQPALQKPTAEETERAAVSTEFHKLVRKRAEMQMRSCDDVVRTEHMSQLRALYNRAKAIRDTFGAILIHSELNRFGITILGEFSLRNNDSETITPKVLISPRTHTSYYLESDGRHVTAIDPEGEIIWCRDPLNDAGLEPYRCTKPIIYSFDFSHAREETITIGFNSSQFGDLDGVTGNFRWRGQD